MAADSADLLFRIRGDSRDGKAAFADFRSSAERDIKSVQSVGTTAFNSLGKSIGLSTDQIGKLRSAVPLVATGIAAVGGAVIGAGAALFSFAKNASDAGSEIFDLSAKTGLSAESLSAWKFALDQSGSSIQEGSQAFVIYQKHLTEAAQKGEKLFGIDAQKAVKDSEFALRELTALINGPMPAGYNKTTLAAELMGRSGANLAATFDTIGGSFDKFLAQAHKMGVVLSREDVKAADEFGDSLSVLGAQASAVGNKFALQFAPQITKAMKDAGVAISENKDLIQSLGATVGFVFNSVINPHLQKWRFELQLIKELASGNQIGAALANAGRGSVPGSASGSPASGQPFVVGEDETINSARDEKARAFLEKQVKDAEALAAKVREESQRIQAQARDAGRSAVAIQAETTFQAAVDEAERAFKLTADFAAYIKALRFAEGHRWEARKADYEQQREEVRRTVEDEVLAAAKIKVIDAEQAQASHSLKTRLLQLKAELAAKSVALVEAQGRREMELLAIRDQRQMQRLEAMAQAEQITYTKAAEQVAKIGEAALERRRKQLEAELKAASGNAEKEAEIKHSLELLEEELKDFQIQASANMTDAKISELERYERAVRETYERLKNEGVDPFAPNPNAVESPMTVFANAGPVVDETGMAPPPEMRSQWEQFSDTVLASMEQAAGGVQTFTNLAAAGFGRMSQAIGGAIQGWVLYGSSIGKAMKQALAAVLAGIAAEAAVRAIFELAKGFASLFFNPAEAAAHFKAAALFGVVAVGAGIAGRAVAGNSFSGAGAGAGGSTAGATSNPYDDRESKRSQYEREQAEKDRYTRKEDRRGYADVPIVLQLDGSELGKAIARIWRDGGDLRETVRRDFKLA